MKMNLWPDLIDEAELQPYEILESQADVFNEEFGRLGLVARFEKMSIANGEWLKVVNGNDGIVELLNINQSDNYPCTVTWEGGKTRARTEAEFIGLLAKVLNSKKTRLMIADLLAK